MLFSELSLNSFDHFFLQIKIGMWKFNSNIRTCQESGFKINKPFLRPRQRILAVKKVILQPVYLYFFDGRAFLTPKCIYRLECPSPSQNCKPK